MSVAPPGGNGTTRRIGRSGQLPAAGAPLAVVDAADALAGATIVASVKAAARPVARILFTSIYAQLRLGSLPRSMQTLMPAVLLDLVDRSPRLRIVLRESTTDTLLRELRTGQLDCVIGRLLPDTDRDDGVRLDYQTLYEDGLCFIAAPGHPLARRRTLTLASLRAERWILPPPGSMARSAFQDEFINAGLTPPVATIESTAFLSNMNLVAHGRLLSISPRSAAEQRSRAGDVRVLPYRLATALPPISLIWRRGEMATGPLRLLRRMLTEHPALQDYPNASGGGSAVRKSTAPPSSG